MFDTLSDRLEGVFKKLKGQGRVSERNIEEALREVRLALLEADVNIGVVRDFIEAGVEVLADEFSLRECGIPSSRLAAGVKVANLDVAMDQLAEGRKALWM